MVKNIRNRLRVAAISFLNPAPLMWDFEHPPRNTELTQRYEIHYTEPALCADELLSGRADLGLIPIAALSPALAIVPGCTIASLDRVRSIQLIVKLNSAGAEAAQAAESDQVLRGVRTVAADTASRSSVAYTQVLFRNFVGVSPEFLPATADAVAMLRGADAALLIGDHALLALEKRQQIEQAVGPCAWLDIAHEWRIRTGLPWVAAVWAIRAEALRESPLRPEQLVHDLQRSRDNGLAHVERLVEEWSPRIAVPSGTIRRYLTENIHYVLNEECRQGMALFRKLAAEAGILAPLPDFQFL